MKPIHLKTVYGNVILYTDIPETPDEIWMNGRWSKVIRQMKYTKGSRTELYQQIINVDVIPVKGGYSYITPFLPDSLLRRNKRMIYAKLSHIRLALKTMCVSNAQFVYVVNWDI